MSGVLVNITLFNDGHFGRKSKYSPENDKAAQFVKNIQATPPKEYVALVQAATALHMAWGSGKLCGHCFKGELHNGHSNGCCDSCANLSDTGCMAKTAACSLHMCSNMNQVYPRHIYEALRDSMNELRSMRGDKGLGMPFYDRGYDADMNAGWTPADLERFTELAAKLNTLAEQLVQENYQPDWADVLPKLGYKPKGDNALRLAVSA